MHVGINSISLRSFVHESVIELHEHACPILMYGPKVVFQKGDVYAESHGCNYLTK